MGEKCSETETTCFFDDVETCTVRTIIAVPSETDASYESYMTLRQSETLLDVGDKRYSCTYNDELDDGYLDTKTNEFSELYGVDAEFTLWPIPETTESGTTDGGATDGGATDGGATDGGATDGGATDGGATDGGSTDSGATDSGSTDAGSEEAGTDTGSEETGTTDAGSTEEEEIEEDNATKLALAASATIAMATLF